MSEYSQIHPVFHVSLLKHYHISDTIKVHTLPLQDINNNPIHDILSVLDKRVIQRNVAQIHQALIQWTGLAPGDSS